VTGTTAPPEPLEPMPADWRRALAVAAHPDDLEYGAAAAVAAWTGGGRAVAYLLVSRGEAGIDGMPPAEAAAVREAEQRASAAAVGVSDVSFLDRPDGRIEYGPALRRDLAAAIRRQRPELVVSVNHHERSTLGGWNSADHRAVGTAVLDAVADAGNRWIFPELAEAGLEPWGGVRWVAVAGSPYPTHAVEVGAVLETAVASLACHRAYLTGLGGDPDPERLARTFVERLAGMGAARFGGRPATAFELVPC